MISRTREMLIEKGLFLTAIFSIIIILLMVLFIFREAVPPICVLTSGTKTMSPKNPYTTDGMAARVSMTGLSILLMNWGASSAMKIAHKKEKGTAMASERKVMHKDPTIIVNTPYSPSEGAHSQPNMKFIKP